MIVLMIETTKFRTRALSHDQARARVVGTLVGILEH